MDRRSKTQLLGWSTAYLVGILLLLPLVFAGSELVLHRNLTMDSTCITLQGNTICGWSQVNSSGGSSVWNKTGNNIWGYGNVGINTNNPNADLQIGSGSINGSFTPQLFLPMVANKSILIDGRTQNRLVDSGVLRFQHTPAIVNTRTITYDINANSLTNTHATVVEFTATGLESGEQGIGHDVQFDTADSTGGVLSALEVSRLGDGSALVTAVKTSSGVSPVVQSVGAYGDVEGGIIYNGTNNSVTSFFNSAVSNVEIFSNDNDIVYVGMDAIFDSIQVVLDTGSSGVGIKPVFEFSAGGGVWTEFFPSDDTLGFRNNGLIWWTNDDIPTWSTDTVNAVNKYWIRIIRTQNSITTPPIEETIKVQSAIPYGWDESGNITAAYFIGDGSLLTNLPSSGFTNNSDIWVNQIGVGISDLGNMSVRINHKGYSGERGVALSVASDNNDSSAVEITGNESNRGTLKISKNYPGGNDSSASVLSLHTRGNGTAAKGIFINSDRSTGNLIQTLSVIDNVNYTTFFLGSDGGMTLTTDSQYGLLVQNLNGNDVFRVQTSSGVTWSKKLIPISTNIYDLGDSTHSWRTFYANNANVSNLNVSNSATILNDIVLGDDIIRSGDTNTVIQGSADQWNFVTGASSRFTINNGGIALSNGKFDLNNNSVHEVNQLNATQLCLSGNCIDAWSQVNLTSGGGSSVWNTTGSDIWAQADVGIGTSNPSSRLEVQGNITVNNAVKSNSNDAQIIFNDVGGVIEYRGVFP